MDLKSALVAAIDGVAASEGQGGSFPVGSGDALFPDKPELDESSWSLTWSGDSSDPIALQAQHKHDVDVLLEFTLQEAQAEADKVVGMALKALQADAAGGA